MQRDTGLFSKQDLVDFTGHYLHIYHQKVLLTGVTVYLVPPSILSPGTLYPVVKCPTLVYLVPRDTLPRG